MATAVRIRRTRSPPVSSIESLPKCFADDDTYSACGSSRRTSRLALAQINPTVGAVAENAALISEWIARARDEGADLVLFAELCLPGYPAEDLYLKRHFLQANADALEELAAEVEGIAALVGFAEPRTRVGDRAARSTRRSPRAAHNSLALLRDGEVELVYRKQRLPNYAVFDEQRYFEPGTEPVVVEIAGTQVGLTICEDVWEPGPPASAEAEMGAELIVCASGVAVLPRQARATARRCSPAAPASTARRSRS